MPPKGSGHRGSKSGYNTRGSTRLNVGANSFEPYTTPTGHGPEHPDRSVNKKQKATETTAQNATINTPGPSSAMEIDLHADEAATNAQIYANLPDPMPDFHASQKLMDIQNEDIPLPDSGKRGYNVEDFLTAAKDASLPSHKQTILQNASRGSGSGTTPDQQVTPVIPSAEASNSVD